MTKEKSKRIMQKLKKYYGRVEAGLSFKNLYELVVSVVLSAQTTDRQVNKVTIALFEKYRDFKSLSAAKLIEVEKIIRSVGLYKTKAKNIINLSKIIANEYKNKVPDEFSELIKLPGIGRKSANVILAMGYKKPAFPVDTHILRIANRLNYVKSSDPYKAELALMQYIPEKEWGSTHLLLIRHGRKICSARKPLCSECPIITLCDYANQ